MITKEQRIEAMKGVLASLFASQRTLKSLAPQFKWAGLGKLFGRLRRVHRNRSLWTATGSARSQRLDRLSREHSTNSNHSINCWRAKKSSVRSWFRMGTDRGNKDLRPRV